MIESVLSPLWYRVAELHPRLRGHVQINRHIYRRQIWFVLWDHILGRPHRINAPAYQIVARLNGQQSVHEVWETVTALLGEDAPTQDEVIQLLSQLNEADLIQCEFTPDAAECFRRDAERTRTRRRHAVNPLAFRVRLFNPTPLLNRFGPLSRPLFHPLTAALFAAMVVVGTLVANANWESIRAHAGLHMLTSRYLLLLWLCYPCVKALHEFAHAFAVRHWGGDVHEMGITLLVLTPVPYVDASASSAFRCKRQRMICAAAGIMAEVTLAIFALGLWLNAQPGLIRDIAFVIMLIGGVSTVVFNANPLLRFDGYYMLCDAFELPNLAQRSNGYMRYLAQRYLFGIKSLHPTDTLRERAWFVVYAIASNLYRVVLSIAIVFWIGAKWAVLGFAVAAWTLFGLVLKPMYLALRFLASAPHLTGHRARAGVATTAIATGVATFIFWLPFPAVTMADGIVWLPEHARVRAGNDGFVVELQATDGQQVRLGDPLVALSEPTLATEQEKIESQLAALQVEYHDTLLNNPAASQAVAEKIANAQANLREIEDRLTNLIVRSEADGVLAMPRPENLLHRYFKKGAVLAHVLSPEAVGVRVALPQDDVALVRNHTKAVQVRLAEHSGQVVLAQLAAEIPAATDTLPSPALGDRAGGAFVTDPTDHDGVRTLEPVFLADLTVSTLPLERVGGRVWVRFDHGAEPLFIQWRRRFGQLFLRHFEAEG